MEDYTIINNIDEIIEFNKKYSTPWRMDKYFEIQKDEAGYCIYGHLCGNTPTFVCIGNNVKFWKTLNNCKRTIKLYAKNDSWAFGRFFPKDYIEK